VRNPWNVYSVTNNFLIHAARTFPTNRMEENNNHPAPRHP
jgi:hypothetical protein